MSSKRLASEEVLTSSPLSFSGATTRYWRATRTVKLLDLILLIVHIPILLVLWSLLLIWNVLAWGVFGWWTILWRILRRGSRRDKRSTAMHREMLNLNAR